MGKPPKERQVPRRSRHGPNLGARIGILVGVIGAFVFGGLLYGYYTTEHTAQQTIRHFNVGEPPVSRIKDQPNKAVFCSTVHNISEPGGLDKFSWFQAALNAPKSVSAAVDKLYDQVQKGKATQTTVFYLKVIGEETCGS